MPAPRNSTAVLINRDQLEQIRQIQEQERQRSGIGACPSIHSLISPQHFRPATSAGFFIPYRSIEVSTPSKVSTGNLSGNIEKPLSKKLPGGGKSQIQRPMKIEREQTPNPSDYGLSDQQAVFAEAVVSGMTRIAAYTKANYKCAGNAAYVGASQVLRNIKVSRYIHALRNHRQARYQIELDVDLGWAAS
ncbi:hypothetical protein [Buttiauxella agrestis]|uniref:hypothetical protein n=1 Tax=Buttiauxella agrestis TaxID=82977 RepID=UPI0015616EE3|nr:hypothetical protein [Buttiauxella agrestis]BCG07790.1 hypothetical protein BADSM9389_04160 [Buttiauxella agrestis]